MDFTSALYLGLRHASATLEPWAQLTTGVPAVLREPDAARSVAHDVAALQGLEAGVLVPSTLHALWDLLGGFAQDGWTLLVDAGAYAVAQWGAERARALGARVITFRHYDAADAERALQGLASSRRRRIVLVADGFCPSCGRAAPVSLLLDAIRQGKGLLVCDDTQGLGILGRQPSAAMPYGYGGGGVLAWSGGYRGEVISVASLAKGFGAPVCCVSGSADRIEAFADRSQTRVHCSPPSAAAVSAARHALGVNVIAGDRLRHRLCEGVKRFRSLLIEYGAPVYTPGLFPVQSLGPFDRSTAWQIQDQLLKDGVTTVLQGERCRAGARVTFLLSARHRPADLDAAARRAANALRVAASSYRVTQGVEHVGY